MIRSSIISGQGGSVEILYYANVCEANFNERTFTKQKVFGIVIVENKSISNDSWTNATQIKHITWLMLNYFHIWFHYLCRKAKYSHIVQMLNVISPRLSEIIYWFDPLNGYRWPVDCFNWNLIFFANFSDSITGLI